MKYLIFVFIFLFLGCSKRSYNTQLYNTHIKKPTKKPYSVKGKFYYPLHKVSIGWTQRGIASWYGSDFHGRYTSSGEVYNMYAYTAAHKMLPVDTMVKVTNLNNGKSVVVRINDRGPFVKGRIIDLSYAAGKKIGLDVTGTAPVEIKVVGFKGKNYINGYMVQVGAFIRKSGAEKIKNKYQNLGYNTIIIKQNEFYKVYLTGFKSYNEAKRFMIAHKINGFVVGE